MAKHITYQRKRPRRHIAAAGGQEKLMRETEDTRAVDTGANRRLTRLDYYLGITLLGGVLLLGDWGIHRVQAGPTTPAVISAREFDVVDAAGHVEARLRSRTADNTDTLEVNDEKNVVRLAIKAHAGQGTAVNLSGPDGTSRMIIAALEDTDETSCVAFTKGDKQLLVVDTSRGQAGIQFLRPDGSNKVINNQ
jgi:hypothetical protein